MHAQELPQMMRVINPAISIHRQRTTVHERATIYQMNDAKVQSLILHTTGTTVGTQCPKSVGTTIMVLADTLPVYHTADYGCSRGTLAQV